MSKFYADRFYKNENGEYFTGEYLKNHHYLDHNAAQENGYIWISYENGMSWDDFNNELSGKTITCNYSQIFSPDSQMILCNNIPDVHPEIWDCIENGDYYDDENDEYSEIFQWYIIDDNTAARLKEHTNEIIFYLENLDLYILGITHWGTGWSHVTTEFIY